MKASRRRRKEERKEEEEEAAEEVEETKHTDLSAIEKGIPEEKNERVRTARRAPRLGDSTAIAVVCFLLTAYACTTHTHPSSEKRERERDETDFFLPMMSCW
jgi:hypothetical protein